MLDFISPTDVLDVKIHPNAIGLALVEGRGLGRAKQIGQDHEAMRSRGRAKDNSVLERKDSDLWSETADEALWELPDPHESSFTDRSTKRKPMRKNSKFSLREEWGGGEGGGGDEGGDRVSLEQSKKADPNRKQTRH